MSMSFSWITNSARRFRSAVCASSACRASYSSLCETLDVLSAPVVRPVGRSDQSASWPCNPAGRPSRSRSCTSGCRRRTSGTCPGWPGRHRSRHRRVDVLQFNFDADRRPVGLEQLLVRLAHRVRRCLEQHPKRRAFVLPDPVAVASRRHRPSREAHWRHPRPE
jgi:hypothetical protein